MFLTRPLEAPNGLFIGPRQRGFRSFPPSDRVCEWDTLINPGESGLREQVFLQAHAPAGIIAATFKTTVRWIRYPMSQS
jgi:hypothetical protein